MFRSEDCRAQGALNPFLTAQGTVSPKIRDQLNDLVETGNPPVSGSNNVGHDDFSITWGDCIVFSPAKAVCLPFLGPL
jgi:hypothetical protein